MARERRHELGSEGTPAARTRPERRPGPPGLRTTEGEALEAAHPVAIVGMACRFPGSKGLSDFWRQLIAGENAVVEGPAGAVIGRAGPLFPKSNVENDAVRFGAFVKDIDRFDADFFRISPIEAQMLDPQQRMMLETSWHALEDAGMDPEALRGSRTGVYAGISTNDYQDTVIDSPDTVDTVAGFFAVTGTALNTAIGRVSFALGLEGPSMAIDTACSSSLVAIHQAVAGLQRCEADLALAGGVHVVLAGRPLELRANAGMLSPEGQCKTFDAAADGFVCGEGCGLVVLKRLSEAEADGDRIWAVIRGSSVNQDGASQGLTVPSGPAQERAMEAALARGGVFPSEVDYLEAHGTGTIVGDPIEVGAAAAVYGRGRDAENPFLIGSVKTNIGHLGPAAGAAGLIKAVLAMRHRLIPRHLNFRNPTPSVDWDRLPVRVTDVMTDWPVDPDDPDRPPLAGVNSFGWSGTNAHVVVQGYAERDTSPDPARISSPKGSPVPVPARSPVLAAKPDSGQPLEARDTRFLPLSGKSPEALGDVASQYLSWLDEHAQELSPEATAAHSTLADMAWTAAAGRSHFGHRAGVLFSDLAELRSRLAGVIAHDAGENSPASAGAKKVAFAYTGQASQWVGMGGILYAREPVFRAVLDHCDGLLAEKRGISLLNVMFGGDGTEGLLDDPTWTQPAIYSLECALTALWESVGVRPSVVVGHSLGEIAAAQAAGVFTLEEGLRLAAVRGTLLGATRSDGAMASVFASASRVASAVAEQNVASDDAELSIAVDNGVQQVVSGAARSLEALLARFETEGVKVVRLRRSPAYHSALVEPALDDLEAAVHEITPAPLTHSVPLVSNLTGRLLKENDRMDASYWRRHAREPVAFRRSVETLAELGVEVVVEVGPHAVLGPIVAMVWPESASAGPPAICASLRRPPRDPKEPVSDTSGGFAEAAAGVYEAGLEMELTGLFSGETRRRVSLPNYPFQRKHHWIPMSKRQRQTVGHPLLGARHESPRGEIMFATEIFSSDPAWMLDHLVYKKVVAPGGLYGAMAVSVALAEWGGPVSVSDMQMRNALIFEHEDLDEAASQAGRELQFVLDPSDDGPGRPFEVLSRGEGEKGWTLHATGRLSSDGAGPEGPAAIDVDEVRRRLMPRDTAEFYRMRSADEIYLGPAYHTLRSVWAEEGESLGELRLRGSVDAAGMEMHPLMLDGCFQVLSVARHLTGVERGAVYMPFDWERLWVTGPIPERILCHATVRSPGSDEDSNTGSTAPPEVVTGDVRFYTVEGVPVGGLEGFTVKRATRAALLSGREGLKELMYEVVWREKPLQGDMLAADFLAFPAAIARQSRTLVDYLADEGVGAAERAAFLSDQEGLSRAYALLALEELGWEREAGAAVSPEGLRRQLGVADDHRRLFARLLRLLRQGGILASSSDGFVVEVGADDPLPDESLADPALLAERLIDRHPHAINELGLLCRCGSALAEVLRGVTDPLGLLFSDDRPGAANVYLAAPAARAANRMLGQAAATAVSDLPEGRRLRVLEVGAGTGSATEFILAALPPDRFDYTFTDISAAFFAQAAERFATLATPIDYRPLDIETDPETQGFDSHGYDLIIAGNVLHATRDLGETLSHCRDLLAPSGQLIALEGLRHRAWQDLTFGLLDGWWRFDDAYRRDHALATPAVWRRALADVGFSDVEFLGPTNPDRDEILGSGVIIARGPEEVELSEGVWVLAADEAGQAAVLAAELASRGQTVVIADGDRAAEGSSSEGSRVVRAAVDPTERESWRSLLEGLPAGMPLKGVVHLMALDGHGTGATTPELMEDVGRAGSSALALVQGVIDTGITPTQGVWFITRGAQILEQDLLGRTSGELAGSVLWGFGKVMFLEAEHLQPRLVDLDAGSGDATSRLVEEILFPDAETQVAYRGGVRHGARLVGLQADHERLALPQDPDDTEWVVGPEDPAAGLSTLAAKPRSRAALECGEIRVAVEAAGLNFADVLLSIGAVPYDREIGREMYGRVVEKAPDIEGFSVGDAVVGLGYGSFAPEVVTQAALAAKVPAGFSATALATMPISFVTAELALEIAGLEAGERVLIHAGTGGVGLAAIELARAAGAEVFATASAAKQPYVRSLGVAHVFDSRQTRFGEEILDATEGEGVHIVLNSLTGEGFIEASLSCLGIGGRFVEISKRAMWSREEMSASRPDISYFILDLDELKRSDPDRAGASLTRVMARVSTGELGPLPYTVWPLADVGSAIEFMREARHIGKNVIRIPPLARDNFRPDRTYLVTGGLGGIGCAVARWLAENGARTIVLNGRRDPDSDAREVIRELREDGADVRVEVADVTDPSSVDSLLARIDETLPRLGGVIHSVGVLSDGAIENQSWDRFEEVLWPKVLGAWQLHRATQDRDLDLFVLFSSVTGVVGNAGQTNHGAANAFLDQLAAHRRAMCLPGQAIAWGAWSGIGEAEEQRERIEKQIAYTGGGWITPQQGISALDWVVRQDVTAPMVTAVDWSVIGQGLGSHPPFLEDLIVTKRPRAREAEAPGSSAGLLSRLRNAPAEERHGLLEAFVREELKTVLRLSSPPSVTVSFFDLGMDSLMAVELRNRLTRAFAGAYTPSNTVVFDYASPASLAEHLSKELGALIDPVPTSEPAASAVGLPVRRQVRRDDDDIAIVGMACRFPGGEDIGTFWRHLEAGEDAVTEGRSDSGSWDGVLGDPVAKEPLHRRGAFVKGIDLFDSRFFRLAPIEARMMDPEQRMLLETSWQALEDAAIDPDRLKGSRTGVCVGVGGSEYRDILASRGQAYDYGGTNVAIAVGRVAFALGLEGPAIPMDLACASSLAAVHQAVVGLQRGEVDMVLAGGVNTTLSPRVSDFLDDMGLLSASGRCSAFDAAADGFVRGEGCGMIVLKRLEDAKADGDRVWGVVLGSAVSQSGRSVDLMAPNGPAQERVMEEALARAGVVPSDVDYLEAQGVGSEYGDPVEINAVAAVYGRDRDAERPLLVGSVKTNIGHLEWAAGIAGLIKTVLAMHHGLIPRNLHFEDPNPLVNWDRLPVRVTSTATAWPAKAHRPPLAAVNTFGLSGANAHLVIEGVRDPTAANGGGDGVIWPVGPARSVSVTATTPSDPGSPVPETEFRDRAARFLPLSAKSPEALQELARRYLGILGERAGELPPETAAADPTLADIAWTAGVGRSHFHYRSGPVFDCLAQLLERLGELAAGEGVHEGPPVAGRVAFVYKGQDRRWLGMGQNFYETEPIVREVLDTCDALFREGQGHSLLEVMFGGGGGAVATDDPASIRGATYALQCGLTALWKSVGISPSPVVGYGLGEIAAAQAAGVFSLEDGLWLAALRGARKPEGGIQFSPPAVTLVSGVTGRVLEPAEARSETYWRKLWSEPPAFDRSQETLAGREVGIVVEIGPDTVPESIATLGCGGDIGAPVVLSSLNPSLPETGFVTSVARAYDMGLMISFEGLFAGEKRSRVSLPGYPFQRRRHWVASSHQD